VPVIVGGRGEKRTLRVVARYADEWNVTRVTREEYAAKRAVLEKHAREVGRDPSTIRHSLMVPAIVGRTPAETTAREVKARTVFPRMPEGAAAWRAAGFLYGTPAELTAELRRWADAGISRVYLQMLDMDDLEAMALLAREVVPACR
jgi:alkanesulfonate monooxygenase SsuD/methylene tetrahydromethanopterin reductase-like flavin-dependent oxidoreductase (luciferase family)